MCDKCEAQATKQGLLALEAIANGEEPPPAPETGGEVSVTIPLHLPFPLVAQISDEGFAMVATTAAGYAAISRFLESIGRPCGPDCTHD